MTKVLVFIVGLGLGWLLGTAKSAVDETRRILRERFDR